MGVAGRRNRTPQRPSPDSQIACPSAGTDGHARRRAPKSRRFCNSHFISEPTPRTLTSSQCPLLRRTMPEDLHVVGRSLRVDVGRWGPDPRTPPLTCRSGKSNSFLAASSVGRPPRLVPPAHEAQAVGSRLPPAVSGKRSFATAQGRGFLLPEQISTIPFPRLHWQRNPSAQGDLFAEPPTAGLSPPRQRPTNH
jgi:hypothetical protein